MGVATAAHTADNTFNLEITPEQDQNPTGATHTLTAHLVSETTNATAANTSGHALEVDFEVESGPDIQVTAEQNRTGNQLPRVADGANTPTTPTGGPDMTCFIPAGGTSCSVAFTSNSAGTNIVRGWIDDDQNDGTQDADTGEGRYAGQTDCVNFGAAPPTDPALQDPSGACPAGATPTSGPKTERDDTDVVQKDWVAQAVQACIDAEPENDVNAAGTEHLITAVVRNTSTFNPTTGTQGDAPGTFDCNTSGAVIANTQVTITILDDNPDIFISRINGVAQNPGPEASTNPSGFGGTEAGKTGPDQVTATTDANGQIVIGVQCATNNCGGGADLDNGTRATTDLGSGIALSVTGAGAGPGQNAQCNAGAGQTGVAVDCVDKGWGTAGQVAEFDASPNQSTNAVNATHTITCSAADVLNAGVANQECDAQVTAGPNATRDFTPNDNVGNPGYIGECITGPTGQCTITYTSPVTGTDTIRVWQDLNRDDTFQPATVGPPATAAEPNEVITKTWVASGQQPSRVAIDMQEHEAAGGGGFGEGGNDFNCDANPTNPDDNTPPDAWNTTAVPNPVTANPGGPGDHLICARAFSQVNQYTPSSITFTIVSGPGFFTNASGTDLGATRTANANQQTAGPPAANCANPANVGPPAELAAGPATVDYACVRLTSNTSGTTTVQACVTGTTICATGTKQWIGAQGRVITCTGTATTPSTNAVGATHTVTCTVTDRAGQAVQDVLVCGRSSGVGFFSGNPVTGGCGTAGGWTASSRTNAQGQVTFQTQSNAEGNQTLEFSINPGGDPTAECTRAANQPAQGNPQGVCSVQRVKEWTGRDTQCSDGEDNDGDGFVDLDDPRCTGPDDNTEGPFDEQQQTVVKHARRIGFHFEHIPRNPNMVIAGQIKVPDGKNSCRKSQPVNIQRFVNGRWITKKSTETDTKGRFNFIIVHKHKRHRAVAPRTFHDSADGSTRHVCKAARKAKRHSHSR